MNLRYFHTVPASCPCPMGATNKDLAALRRRLTNLRDCGGSIIRREGIEKGWYSLVGVASRSAARSGGIGIDRSLLQGCKKHKQVLFSKGFEQSNRRCFYTPALGHTYLEYSYTWGKTTALLRMIKTEPKTWFFTIGCLFLTTLAFWVGGGLEKLGEGRNL